TVDQLAPRQSAWFPVWIFHPTPIPPRTPTFTPTHPRPRAILFLSPVSCAHVSPVSPRWLAPPDNRLEAPPATLRSSTHPSTFGLPPLSPGLVLVSGPDWVTGLWLFTLLPPAGSASHTLPRKQYGTRRTTELREGAPLPPPQSSLSCAPQRTTPHHTASHSPSSLLFLAPAHCAPREPELPPVDSHPPTFDLAPSSPHSFPCANLPTLPTFCPGHPPTLSLFSLCFSYIYLSSHPSLACLLLKSHPETT
ncbi:hypothetical protein CCUS01_03867, partial [Colletotrichum cuscutae]